MLIAKTHAEADGPHALQPIIPVSFNEGLVGGFGVGQTPINRYASLNQAS